MKKVRKYGKIKNIAICYGSIPENMKGDIMSFRKNIVVKDDDGRYSKRFTNPVVPEGYRHVEGTDWKNGFRIERIKDGSLLQFVPVGSLKSNGTLDGKKYNEKFGRRPRYPNDPEELGEEPICGTMNPLWNQLQSIREYGGFYSTWPISRSEYLKPVSIPGRQPWTMVNFERAMELATSFETSNGLSSHLLYGAEYDSILEWFIESKRMTVQEITEQIPPRDYRTFYSYDILGFGNVAVWTQEKSTKGTVIKPAVRGATLKKDGSQNPLAWRQETHRYIKRPYIGLQVALFIPIA